MQITFNEYGWPLFDDLKAHSPSSLCKILNYIVFGNINKFTMIYAKARGNEIENGLLSYLSNSETFSKEEAKRIAISSCKTIKKKQHLIKLIYWFDKKFPNAKLISSQEIIYKYPYGAIIDFKFTFKDSGKQYILELKTNNYEKYTPLLRTIWDITGYIQNYCSGLDNYFCWVTEKKETKKEAKFKLINYKWKMPTDYNLLELIKELHFINQSGWELENKICYIKEVLTEMGIKWNNIKAQ